MKLTDKAKNDFEKWYLWVYKSFIRTANMPTELEKTHWKGILQSFYNQKESEKYGVYVDWFDSVGLRINIVEFGELKFQVQFYQYDGDKSLIIIPYNTRQEARVQAILKANEIYNGK